MRRGRPVFEVHKRIVGGLWLPIHGLVFTDWQDAYDEQQALAMEWRRSPDGHHTEIGVFDTDGGEYTDTDFIGGTQ